MCVVLAGATPVFADVDPDSGCITPESAEAVRSSKRMLPSYTASKRSLTDRTPMSCSECLRPVVR